MSGVDSGFLSLERPHMPLHVTAVCVLNGPPGDADRYFGALLQRLAEMVSTRPVLRLGVRMTPLGFNSPLWVEWESVDVALHVRRVVIPAEGAGVLENVCSDLLAEPLQMDRPLWDMWFLESHSGGSASSRGLVARAHHAVADGLAGIEVVTALFGTKPDAAGRLDGQARSRRRSGVSGPAVPVDPRTDGAVEAQRCGAAAVPAPAALAAYDLVGLAFRPLAAGAALGRSARALIDAVLDSRADPSGLPPRLPRTIPPKTILNRSITAARQVAFGRVAVSDVRAIRRREGVALNDVVLAICASSVREYLAQRSSLPVRPLVALVPLAIRGAAGGASGSPRNRVTAAHVPLATDAEDPLERLHRIAEFTAALGDRPASTAGLASEWLDALAPGLASAASRLVCALRVFDYVPPLFNLVVSAVPGPRTMLAPGSIGVESIYPLGPVVEGAALNITAITYGGYVHFGVVTCPDVVDGATSIAEGLQRALGTLLRATSPRGAIG